MLAIDNPSHHFPVKQHLYMTAPAMSPQGSDQGTANSSPASPSFDGERARAISSSSRLEGGDFTADGSRDTLRLRKSSALGGQKELKMAQAIFSPERESLATSCRINVKSGLFF